MQDLGPVAVKASQILATRRDVLPAVLCEELARLHDHGEALSPRRAREAFDDAYGSDFAVVFASIDYTSVASGSVACVYRAELQDGRTVAVKLKRPGVDAAMATDLELIERAARLVARLPWLRGIPVRRIAEDVCGAVRAQGDFAREARELQRLRSRLSALPRVTVPWVEPTLSRDRAIVMEYVPDLAMAPPRRSPSATRGLASLTLDAVYRLLFLEGFVHCDLHPGNLYFTQRNRVVVLDAGFSIVLDDRLRRLFAEFFLFMSLGRGHRCAEVVIESAAGRAPGADLDGFRTSLAELVERNSRVAAEDFSLAAFAAEMFRLQRRAGLIGASELVFPLLCLLVIEGTIRELDPGMDFQAAAQPVVSAALFGT
jgi:ubiquinone biosynthesis protein